MQSKIIRDIIQNIYDKETAAIQKLKVSIIININDSYKLNLFICICEKENIYFSRNSYNYLGMFYLSHCKLFIAMVSDFVILP